MTRQKRSRVDLSALQIPWLDQDPGGSAPMRALASGGGGSPDFCGTSPTPVKGATDPRLAELRQIGLSPLWQRVASQIGFEPFLALWELLATASAETDDRNRVCVPAWRTYLRYQRNRLIRTLGSAGHSPARIRELLRERLGEELSEVQIKRALQ